MGRFDRDNHSGKSRSFGRPAYSQDRPMYKATCDRCGKTCELPFKPSGNKPVFCKDCFNSSEGFDSRRSENRSPGKFNSEDRQMYDAVCANCGNDCRVPFRPTQGRQVLCSRCFEKNDTHGSDRKPFDRQDNRPAPTSPTNYHAQFEALNAKMDRILTFLTPTPMGEALLDSVIDENTIKEIDEKIQTENKKLIAKKPKKEKVSVVKALAKRKKTKSLEVK